MSESLIENKEPFDLLSWYPATLGALDRPWNLGIQLPTFARAKSRRYFERFKVILGVESKSQLMEQWQRIFPEKPDESQYDPYNRATLFRRLTHLDQIDTV